MAKLKQNSDIELLKFATAGSVDDGKSTLIGRLLLDSKNIYKDQLEAVEKDSKKLNREKDLALLTDGLKAEREQGITIDVAYRYFATAKRRFILADTPGHEQYTRNMVTGISNSDVVIILIDSRNGITTQTKRHAFISSLMGIKRIVLAVNKMDLVGYKQEVFNKITSDFKDFCTKLNFTELVSIPISALKGDNVVNTSKKMPWYKGVSVIEYLENVYIDSDTNLQDFRFPVQLVSRPNSEFRGYMGTVASGIIRKNEAVIIMPSMKKTSVKSIVTYNGEVKEAFCGMAVTLTLKDDIDVSRGCILAKPNNIPLTETYIDTNIVWMSEKEAKTGDEFIIKHAFSTTKAVIEKIQYVFNPKNISRQEQKKIKLNQIARVRIRTYKELIFDEYANNKITGSFILIDKLDNSTVAAGMILNKIKTTEPSVKNTVVKSKDIKISEGKITSAEREKALGHKPAVIWFVGLSGSGKSTIARELEKELFQKGCLVYVFDGDNIRFGLNRDLGFGQKDRQENIRRIAEVAKLYNASGGIAIAACITPFEESRKLLREIIGKNYIEVYLDVSVDECIKRDTKGLYKKAIAGEIQDFTGISSPFEIPENSEIKIDTTKCTVKEAADTIINYLKKKKIIKGK